MNECEMCGGPLELMGALGLRYHYRCRNCGMQASTETPPPEADEEEESRDEQP